MSKTTGTINCSHDEVKDIEVLYIDDVPYVRKDKCIALLTKFHEQQLSEYKEKLKAEIGNFVKENKSSHLLTESEVLTLIDKIQ